MTPGRSNIQPEQLDSHYNVSSAQFKIRHLLKSIIFADSGLTLGFGRESIPETDFYVSSGVGTGDLGVVFFLLSLLFLNQCW